MTRHLQCATDPRMIRAWSENDPSLIRAWNRQPATRLATEVTFRARREHFLLKNTTFRAPAIIPKFTKCCAYHEKWHLNFIQCCACHAKWLSWLIFVTYETLFTILQHHRIILRLPRKMTVMTDPRHIWNVIYNARSNNCHPPTSPNNAPATQNDCQKFQRNFSKTDDTSFTTRDGSENDPSRIREWSDHETVRPQPASQPRLHFALATSIFYWKIQRFALGLSFQISRHAAPATKSDTWTSPNTAGACHEKWHLNCTKCCACHEKWHLNFTKCCNLARKVRLELHQMLHLPRSDTWTSPQRI